MYRRANGQILRRSQWEDLICQVSIQLQIPFTAKTVSGIFGSVFRTDTLALG